MGGNHQEGGWVVKTAFIRTTGIALFIWSCALTIKAEDLPRDERQKGTHETTLSEVDVYKDTIAVVVSSLGRPNKTIETQDTSIVAGGRDFIWKRDGVRLVVGTWNDKGNESTPYSVEVWGPHSNGLLGSTGRGLKLGDTLRAIIRIYGRRFAIYKFSDGRTQVTLQWRDNTTLYVYLDRSGHIDHMHLLAAPE